jgi:SagB-type dehydrogenase family enzyme
MRRLIVCVLTVGVVTGACSTPRHEEGTIVETMQLPVPEAEASLTLEETIARRRSIREFTPEPLTMKELSLLLWAAQGVTDEAGKRAAPSAGALYPIEVYVADAGGLYHYVPDGHRLEVLSSSDLRSELSSAALDQTAVGDAAAVFIISAVVERTAAKYGNRAERYVTLEAGHVGQNILLEAVALGLGAVPIGAFSDDSLAEVIGMEDGEAPLYVIPVGHPDR